MAYTFEPMRLAAHSEGKMPSPPGPVIGRNPSQTPARSSYRTGLYRAPTNASAVRSPNCYDANTQGFAQQGENGAWASRWNTAISRT